MRLPYIRHATLLTLAMFALSGCSSLQASLGAGESSYPNFKSIAFFKGKFLAVGDDGTGKNQIFWIDSESAQVQKSQLLPCAELEFIEYLNGKLITGGSCASENENKSYVLLSEDGYNWEKLYVNPASDEYYLDPNYILGMSYGSGLYFAWGDASFSGYSRDLKTWHRLRDTKNEPLEVVGIFYLNNKYIAASHTTDEHGQVLSSYVYISQDGATYTPYRLGNDVVLGSQMTFGKGTYVSANGNDFLLSGNFRRGLLSSSNGERWNLSYENKQARIYDVAIGNGIFVAVGGHLAKDVSGTTTFDQGVVLTSHDGRSWTEQRFANGLLASVAFGNGAFMAVGDHGVIARSKNGDEWEIFEYSR